MTVTKQQQLEWLEEEFAVWPGFGGVPIRMSSVTIGEVNNGLGVAHHIMMEEWQQERDKMSKTPDVTISNQTSATITATQVGDSEMTITAQDNSWRERGELPPVGCECEIRHKCWSEFRRVTVAAITKEYVIVVDGQREQHYHLRDITFRPLRTEREKAIDAFIEIICAGGELSKDGSAAREIAERIYDAGMLK